MSSKSTSSKAPPPPGVSSGAASRLKTLSSNSSTTGNKITKIPLYEAYPANSILELTLSPNDEVVRGLVYCTDEISNTVVLKRSQRYTTLTSEIRIVNVACIRKKRVVKEVAPSSPPDKSSWDDEEDFPGKDGNEDEDIDLMEELAIPLPNVSRKAVEERERRAIRLAEESFGHINQNATPEGQAVFDRLLKACNEVVWSGESILVLNQIRVDPPYASDNCKLLQKAGGNHELNESSLERVKRIVGAG